MASSADNLYNWIIQNWGKKPEVSTVDTFDSIGAGKPKTLYIVEDESKIYYCYKRSSDSEIQFLQVSSNEPTEDSIIVTSGDGTKVLSDNGIYYSLSVLFSEVVFLEDLTSGEETDDTGGMILNFSKHVLIDRSTEATLILPATSEFEETDLMQLIELNGITMTLTVSEDGVTLNGEASGTVTFASGSLYVRRSGMDYITYSIAEKEVVTMQNLEDTDTGVKNSATGTGALQWSNVTISGNTVQSVSPEPLQLYDYTSQGLILGKDHEGNDYGIVLSGYGGTLFISPNTGSFGMNYGGYGYEVKSGAQSTFTVNGCIYVSNGTDSFTHNGPVINSFNSTVAETFISGYNGTFAGAIAVTGSAGMTIELTGGLTIRASAITLKASGDVTIENTGDKTAALTLVGGGLQLNDGEGTELYEIRPVTLLEDPSKNVGGVNSPFNYETTMGSTYGPIGSQVFEIDGDLYAAVLYAYTYGSTLDIVKFSKRDSTDAYGFSPDFPFYEQEKILSYSIYYYTSSGQTLGINLLGLRFFNTYFYLLDSNGIYNYLLDTEHIIITTPATFQVSSYGSLKAFDIDETNSLLYLIDETYLRVFDLSEPTAWTEVSARALEGLEDGIVSIQIVGNTLYTLSTSVKVRTYDTDAGTWTLQDVQEISLTMTDLYTLYVKDNLLYVSGASIPDGFFANVGAMQVFDRTDPTSPVELSSDYYLVPLDEIVMAKVTDIRSFGDDLYCTDFGTSNYATGVGRAPGMYYFSKGVKIETEHYLKARKINVEQLITESLEVSNPFSSVLEYSEDLWPSEDYEIPHIAATNDLITTAIQRNIQLTSYGYFDFASTDYVFGHTISGDYLFAAIRNSSSTGSIKIVDIRRGLNDYYPAATQTVVGTISSVNASDIQVFNDILFVMSAGSVVGAYDVTIKSKPVLISTWALGGYGNFTRNHYKNHIYFYANGDTSVLNIFDFNDRTNIVHSTFSDDHNYYSLGYGIAVIDHYYMEWAGGLTINIYDLENDPKNPTFIQTYEVGSFDSGYYIGGIFAINDETILITPRNETLSPDNDVVGVILDISDIDSISEISTLESSTVDMVYNNTNACSGAVINNNYVFYPHDGGIAVFDILDITDPEELPDAGASLSINSPFNGAGISFWRDWCFIADGNASSGDINKVKISTGATSYASLGVGNLDADKLQVKFDILAQRLTALKGVITNLLTTDSLMLPTLKTSEGATGFLKIGEDGYVVMEVDSLTQDVDDLNTSLADLTTTLGATNTTVSSLSTSITTLQETLTKLQQSLTTVQTDLTSVETSLEDKLSATAANAALSGTGTRVMQVDEDGVISAAVELLEEDTWVTDNDIITACDEATFDSDNLYRTTISPTNSKTMLQGQMCLSATGAYKYEAYSDNSIIRIPLG